MISAPRSLAQLRVCRAAGWCQVKVPTLACRPLAPRISRVRYQTAKTEGRESNADAAASEEATDENRHSRTIILAVDESPESEYAVDWAMQQLHRQGDSFKLVHCVPGLSPGRLVAVPGGGLLRVPKVDPVLVAEKARADIDSKLAEKFKGLLEQAGVTGTFHVLAGPAAAAAGSDKASIGSRLCQIAKELSAAAVVIASASKGGIQEALQGSVAANLVHHCEVPVVVLHRPKGGGQRAEQAMKDSEVTWLLSATAGDITGQAAASKTDDQTNQDAVARNLVVAVDDSDEGFAAVGWVIQNLWRPGDLLHLLHVVPALPAHMTYSLAPDGMMYSLPLPQLEEAEVEESQWRTMLMERLGPLLQSNNINFQVDVLTDYGSDPLQGIAGTVVATAEKLNAAALVLCGHSKGTVADWLLGSVSDFAAHHAGVPVVVLHGPQYSESE